MYKPHITLIVIFFTCYSFATSQIRFKDYFIDDALRIDFILAGDHENQACFLDQVVQEPYWGGRQSNLDSTLNLGEFRVDVQDTESGNLIYSEGFSTLFEEWQTTDEALSMKRSFMNSVQIPFPKQKIELTILHRTQGVFNDSLLHLSLDPNDQIIKQTTFPKTSTRELLKNGKPEKCVDIAIIAEGYTSDQQELFFTEAQKFAQGLFTSEPFAKHKKKFNIYAIAAISQDSGVDNPHDGNWVNTALNCSFNTLYSDRYLMTFDVKAVRDYAALVPYDQIYIIANTDKYGGGGILNYYSICASRGRSETNVFIHEFGHSFAGLGDEYYTSDVSYSDFFDLTLEPWQPNITTLIDFDSKWKSMIDKDTPIPTPAAIKYQNKIGVFEGGGYSAKNIYRPAFDCRMKSNEAKDFCEVCGAAIERTIEFLTEKD